MVQLQSKANLTEVGGAGCHAGAAPGRRENREEQRCQQPYYRDHDKQLDEGETGYRPSYPNVTGRVHHPLLSLAWVQLPP
jgi:hypothetical protein